MTTILIADSSKPSLVMTSEIFKDKILGTVVDVAGTGKDALEYLANKKPDLCVVDFDLPDVDGPALIEAMRRLYDGPILMTAFPGEIVEKASKEHLFAFDDASDWIAKPVNFDVLADKIDRFLIAHHRLEKRFQTNLSGEIVIKAEGRGKRAVKLTGKIVNLSLSGARMKLTAPAKLKMNQEVLVSFQVTAHKKAESEKKSKVSRTSATKSEKSETKIKATVAWMAAKGEIGLGFAKLTDLQRKHLENFFKTQNPVEKTPAKGAKSTQQKSTNI